MRKDVMETMAALNSVSTEKILCRCHACPQIGRAHV